MIEAAVQKMIQRLQHVIGRGRVTTGDDSGNVQLLQVKLGPDEIRDNTPRLAEYGLTSMPPVGSDALLVFVGGDRWNGAIVATGHQASRLKGLAPGEVAIYDDQGQSVYLTRAGIVINGAGLPITVKDTPKVTVTADTMVELDTPLLKVSGDIIDNAGSNTKTMAQMRQIYDSHNHLVRNVQGGSSTVTSDSPTQQQ